MSEFKIQLSGKTAVIAVVILVVILGIRLVSFSDKTGDRELTREIELLLMSEYYPDAVSEMQEAYDQGNMDELERLAGAVTRTKLVIESVKTSAPLLSFSSSTDVIVRVEYLLKDESKNSETKRQFYRFKHGAIGNSWQYRSDSNIVSYYLNFT